MKKIINTLFLSLLVCILFGTSDVYALKLNSNIEYIYHYNKDCKNGDESTCVSAYYDVLGQKAAPGTIIKYKVNETDIKSFYVVSDDNNKITMITKDNINNGVNETFLVQNTDVNTRISYYINHYTNVNRFKLADSNAQLFGRAITKDEVGNLSSTVDVEYLDWLRPSNGITCYWTMSLSNNKPYAVFGGEQLVAVVEVADYKCGLKAIVEIDKYDDSVVDDNTSSDDDKVNDSENNNSENNVQKNEYDKIPDEIYGDGDNKLSSSDVIIKDDGQVVTKDGKNVYDKNGKLVYLKDGQQVKVDDTLKMAYIGYVIGIVVLVLGVMVLVQTFRKKEEIY